VLSLPHAESPFTAILFVLLALAHGHLVATVLQGHGSEPWPIFAGHVVCFGIADAAAVAARRGRGLKWAIVFTYGVAGALLLMVLGPAFGLPQDECTGYVVGAVIVVAVASAGAWRLRRHQRVG
jgi:hypothetical protein